jgi:hypothetical protein
MLTRILEIVISLAIIVIITFIGDRFRGFGGIIASMPLTIPMTLVIVFLNTSRSHDATAQFLRSAVGGIFATAVFTLVAWLTVRRHWPIPWVIASGYAAWGVTVLAWQGLARWLARGG